VAHDVFISYSTHDKAVADRICHALEERQVRCWIAPRDVPFGADWPRAIMDALATARAVVLVFTSNTNASQAVRKEVLAAVENGAIVIPFRTEDVLPEGALRFNLIDVHWLDAFSPPLDNHIDSLVQRIRVLTTQDLLRTPSDVDLAGGGPGGGSASGPGGDIPEDFAKAERERRDQLEQLRRDRLDRHRSSETRSGEGVLGAGGQGQAGAQGQGAGPSGGPGMTPQPKPEVGPPQSWIATPLHRQFYALAVLAVLLSLLSAFSPWLLLAAPIGIALLWRRSYVPRADMPELASRGLRIGVSVAVALLAIALALVFGAQVFHPRPTHDYHITLANQTGQTVSNIYASHQSGPVISQDRLGSTTLQNGSSLQLDLNDGSGECNWSFREVVPSGPNISQDNIDVCTTSTLTLQANGATPASSATNTTSTSDEPTAGNSVGASRYGMHIVNAAGKTIRNLYMSSDGQHWSNDLLGSSNLQVGAKIHVNFDDGSGECVRSLKAVYYDNTDTEHYAINVCTTDTYTFTQ
jgi:hypothetical protein